jgi:formamidopyrimidine-DNA glycosylase
MTGNLLIVRAGDIAERPYTRVEFLLDNADRVLFTDPRRFGTGVVLLGDDALEDYFNTRLGVEPLSPDFTTDALRTLARNRKQPVKAFLLNQERLAGVGNIYADEALFKARIHPLRPVGTLKRSQLDALREGVIESLEAGIDSRGASIDDYRNPDGAEGMFQTKFQVHLREGEPCIRCGTTIKKMRAAGRGTYVCEKCQPKPRRRRQAASRV